VVGQLRHRFSSDVARATGACHTVGVARYVVAAKVGSLESLRSNPRTGQLVRRTVTARCATDAVCELVTQYVAAGLVVDWTVRRAGPLRLGRRWSGRFVPEGGDDGSAGVREPRTPRPSAGSAAAAVDPA
jgi:hypothetical protein